MPEPTKEAVERLAWKLIEYETTLEKARYVISLLAPCVEALESMRRWPSMGNKDGMKLMDDALSTLKKAGL